MFAGRQRVKKTPAQGAASPVSTTPQVEGNATSSTRHVYPDASDELNTLPSSVTEVMSVVRLSWDFMTNADFNAIPYSLSMLDGSSLGSDYSSFVQMYEGVESAMDLVVNDYHQAFNTAIQKFSSVVDTISDSQVKVKDVRENLEQSKEWLECKRYDLLHLWVKSIQFKEMSRLLDSIVELQSTQDKLESLVQNRQYLHAVRILVAAEHTIYGADLAEIDALSNMREKLGGTKVHLQETLTTELQNHIYLKSKSALNRIGKDIPGITAIRADLDIGSPASDILRFSKGFHIHDEADGDTTNVEVDSFGQIQVLLEGLFHLNKLPESLAFMKERIGIDLYHVVDRALSDIEILHPQDGEGDSNGPEEHYILHVFLNTLYERLQAVLDGHIFAIDCANLLFKSKDIAIEEVYTKREVATAIQNEVKALLYDYLTTSTQNVNVGIPVLAISEMLRENKKGTKRQSKHLYHLKVMAEESVKKAFTDSCPDDKAISSPAIQPDLHGEADRFSSDIKSGHRLLIASKPANILVVYKPTLNFMNNMEKGITVRLANFKMYLEDFIFNVYLPQVQEQVLVYYHSNVNGVDAFQADLYPDAPYPLTKSALHIVLQMHGICRTIKCMPIHADELVKYVEQTLKKYYEKCSNRFRGLISGDSGNEEEEEPQVSVLSVQWATEVELIELFVENTYLGGKTIDLEKNQVLLHKETMLEMRLKGERSFHRSELFLDSRKIEHLAHLIYGIEWVVDQIGFLRGQEFDTDLAESFNNTSKANMATFSTLSEESLLTITFDADTNIELPLNAKLDESFTTISKQFLDLAEHALYSIRIEIRFHSIFYLDLAMREGNYCQDKDDSEPDPYIGLLNTDLTVMEEMISEALAPRKARFLFDGITQLMTSVLISNLKQIKQINIHGVNRLVSNVHSLQQNLISFTVVFDKDLEKAKKYFTLLAYSGSAILEFLSKNPGLFTFEEYRVILKLVYNEINGNQEEGKVITKKLEEYFVSHRS